MQEIADYDQDQLPAARFLATSKDEKQSILQRYRTLRRICNKIYAEDFWNDWMTVSVAFSCDDGAEPVLIRKTVAVKSLCGRASAAEAANNADNQTLEPIKFLTPIADKYRPTGYVQFEYHGRIEKASLLAKRPFGVEQSLHERHFVMFDSDTDAKTLSFVEHRPGIDFDVYSLHVDLSLTPNTLAALQIEYQLVHRHMTMKELCYASKMKNDSRLVSSK